MVFLSPVLHPASRSGFYLSCAAALLLMPAYAQAQVVPRNAEADVVGKQQKLTPPPSAPAVRGVPDLVVEAPEGADKAQLTLNQLIIEGSTVYSPTELETFYRDLLHKNISLADIYVVAARITRRYQDDGYLISKAYIPPQQITGGVVRIMIVEGRVGKVRWEGDPIESGMAQSFTDQLLASRPLNGRDLESAILNLNDLPGLQAQATLAPSQQEGVIDIVMQAKRTRLSAELVTDSYASRYLGVWQSTAQANINGLATGSDRVSLHVTSSLDAGFLRYRRAEYMLPVYTHTTLRFGIGHSHSEPGYTLESLDVESNALTRWIGISRPIIRTRDENFLVSAQFNLHDQDTKILGADLSEDRLRTLQLSGVYSTGDGWGGSNLLGVDVVKGLNILNATKTGSAGLSRASGHSDFTKVTMNASRTQTLIDQLSIQTSANGQLSNRPLLSSEQFGYGGSTFGRAYDAFEISRDQGVAASVELTYNTGFGDDFRLQPYAFYDIGKGWNHANASDARSGASAGFGTRAQLFERVQCDFGIAKPLTTPTATPKLGADKNDPRVSAQIRIAY